MVIIGSVRPGRVGLPVAEWVATDLSAVEGIEVDLVDLAELALPLMDEPNHPMQRRYTKPHTIAWSERVAAADAIVLVTPEYNHSFSPALKNALDYLNHEWRHKPVTFVSYGGVSAGTRGVEGLKAVTSGLGLYTTAANVEINFPTNLITDDGIFEPSETHRGRLAAATAELIALTDALRPLRTP
ncbi:NADPH-dependent FMN reductase [Amnibacterium flavum]|uniref:NADPH-dependent FMN reductase n=1 Tax=Amnibacterium flavum TaxID=2173173 RepID=A0A2V1HLV4_9MICO|nr:NAD(P)H-dependent oxidoreductase [Amnibacterium flavum]PVZ93435.1 NADPH-dependent FMN reductase [Amnibacterium flavum]